MLSAVFVDRPRLAIVIALVTTIAGLLSLVVIPLAQYPDIVPPQVSVTTMYPGANSTVVDATVAQAIEAQVVGVDKMIYMKSVSGDDGSYTLICSFELGTDPDINAVNVNNRVQIALPSLPDEVQRQGITVKKKSSALLGVIAVYSPKHTYDPLFLSNYVTINLLDQIKSTPGVGDAVLWGPQDYAMRAWVQNRQVDRPQPDHRRHHQGDPVAERAGGGRPHRRPADLERPAAPAQHPDKGAADLGGGVREDRDPHQSGRLGAAARRCRAAGTRRRQSRSRDAVQRRPGRGDRDLPDTRRKCDRDPESRSKDQLTRIAEALSRTIWPGRSPTTRRSSSPKRSMRCRRR